MVCVRALGSTHLKVTCKYLIGTNKSVYASLLQGAEVGEDGHWKRGELVRAQTKNPVGRKEAEV